MTDQIRCVDCKHFQQERDIFGAIAVHFEKWGRCKRAVDATVSSLFYPDGEFCADIWLEVHHDFGCVMAERKTE